MSANKLVKLKPISSGTSNTDAGPFAVQKIIIDINGSGWALNNGSGLAVDRSQYIYVSDAANHVIYRYRFGDSQAHIIAGSYGVSGYADGQGVAAKFNQPGPLFCDRSGRVWIVDIGNKYVRRMDGNNNVFTVAALPTYVSGDMGGIVVDDSENIFYIDKTT